MSAEKANLRVIFVLGGPGSGKGTQASRDLVLLHVARLTAHAIAMPACCSPCHSASPLHDNGIMSSPSRAL